MYLQQQYKIQFEKTAIHDKSASFYNLVRKEAIEILQNINRDDDFNLSESKVKKKNNSMQPYHLFPKIHIDKNTNKNF